MCTIVYIPRGRIRILASLRDENPQRAVALVPTVMQHETTSLVMPVDPQGGGSWIGFNDSRSAVVLMNGGFEKHDHTPPYRLSRGLVVKQLLESRMPVIEWMIMPMEGIEPFSLITWADEKLFRLTWDGMEKHREKLDEHASHIFSSSTLYTNAAHERRREHFNNWLATAPDAGRHSLLRFFTQITDPSDGFMIDRSGQMKTLSYSYMELRTNHYRFYYYDLIRCQQYASRLPQPACSNCI